MKQQLVPLLVCPTCRARLSLAGVVQGDEEIEAGELRCAGGHTFPITGGVPRLLPGQMADAERRTAQNFGDQWHRFSRLSPLYERQFLEWLTPATPGDFAGRTILDAGCGKGRHLAVAAQYGAKDVIGVDLSSAVDVAYQHVGRWPNVHVVQADLLHLPFERPFDYIYSIGVLHHLPDPEAGFRSLAGHLAKGGTLAAWVYAAENNGWITRFVDPVRTHVTSAIPPAALTAVSAVLAAMLWTAAKGLYRPALRWLPPLGRRLFYADYVNWLATLDFQEVHCIAFDHLVAPTAHYIGRAELETWLNEAGLGRPSITAVRQNSWSAQGVLQRLASG